MNCLFCLLYRVLCESFFFFFSTPFGSGGTKNLRLPNPSHWSRHMALGVGQSGSHLESQSLDNSFLKKCWSLENPGAPLITGLSVVWLFSFFFSPRVVHYPSKTPLSRVHFYCFQPDSSLIQAGSQRGQFLPWLYRITGRNSSFWKEQLILKHAIY